MLLRSGKIPFLLPFRFAVTPLRKGWEPKLKRGKQTESNCDQKRTDAQLGRQKGGYRSESSGRGNAIKNRGGHKGKERNQLEPRGKKGREWKSTETKDHHRPHQNLLHESLSSSWGYRPRCFLFSGLYSSLFSSLSLIFPLRCNTIHERKNHKVAICKKSEECLPCSDRHKSI